MRDLSERMFSIQRMKKKLAVYQGLNIVIDALIRYNDRYVQELERKGMTGPTEICNVPNKYPARNFRNCSIRQYGLFTVTQDSGTLWSTTVNYYLWPYLNKDLNEGTITMQEAFDLCGISCSDGSADPPDEEMNDTVCLGSHPNENPPSPLTYVAEPLTEPLMGR